MKNKEEYYVYVYLDPRKRGNFVYGDLIFEYEPFYIGKGKGLRLYVHLKEAERGEDRSRDKNSSKHRKILKIKSLGMCPVIQKIDRNLSQDTALDLEAIYIKKIGNIWDKNGPLLNISKGGIGGDTMSNNPNKKEIFERILEKKSGYKHSEEAKKNMSIAQKNRDYTTTEYAKVITYLTHFGRKITEEERKKRSEAVKGDKNPFYGKKHTPETLEKIKKTKEENPYVITETHRENLRKAKSSPEARKKLSDSLKGRKLSEEHKKNISEGLKRNSDEKKKK